MQNFTMGKNSKLRKEELTLIIPNDFGELIAYLYFNPEIELRARGKAPSVKGKRIKRVIYNNPATVIIWDDDTKTIAKCEEGDTYDREKGFYICLLKALLGNKATRTLINNEWDNWR